MPIPSIAKNLNKARQRAAIQQPVDPVDAAATQQVAQAAQLGGLPMTPSQQIRQQLMALTEYNLMKQKEAIFAAQQANAPVPADILQQQRAQLALQEDLIKQQIKAKLANNAYMQIAPKQTVQNTQNTQYVTPEHLAYLEQAYYNVNAKNKKQLAMLGLMSHFNANLKPYQGIEFDPNYDKAMRPLGRFTNSLSTF